MIMTCARREVTSFYKIILSYMYIIITRSNRLMCPYSDFTSTMIWRLYHNIIHGYLPNRNIVYNPIKLTACRCMCAHIMLLYYIPLLIIIVIANDIDDGRIAVWPLRRALIAVIRHNIYRSTHVAPLLQKHAIITYYDIIYMNTSNRNN